MEIWKKVKDFPGYEVSDRGRVRSVDRLSRRGQNIRGRILKPGISIYPLVTLSRGETKSFFIHRLVLEAFVGKRPKGKEACHNNGDPLDCRLANLRWDTPKSNASDCTKHGTRNPARGEQSGAAKLTEENVRVIRARHASGDGLRELGREYRVDHMTISRIVKRTGWTHVE